MRVISIAELRRRFSAYLRSVRAGGEIVVTDRGRPVAKLVPLGDDAIGEDAHTAELVRRGAAKPPGAPVPPDFWDRPRPADPAGRSLEALLEERESGR